MKEYSKRFFVLGIVYLVMALVLCFILGYSMGTVSCYDECLVSNEVASRCLREH